MKEKILNLIPNSRFITRAELVEATGLSDRVRRLISGLKKEHTIISLSGKGYRKVKYTDDMSQEEIQAEYEGSKALYQ